MKKVRKITCQNDEEICENHNSQYISIIRPFKPYFYYYYYILLLLLLCSFSIDESVEIWTFDSISKVATVIASFITD